ncbi:DUF2569 family protein [Candidatus Saccharibacteria bacterium]|nr:DUF2569 family protein [Candidatus Saccharibacteria bacterium]
MKKEVVPAPAEKKKNEKLTGWLGTFVALTIVGAAWTLIGLVKNHFQVLSDCGQRSSILIQNFCREITPPVIAEIIAGFVFVALAIVAVTLVYKRKKISIPYVIAFEALVLAWNIIDVAITMSVLGPYLDKVSSKTMSSLIVSLVVSVVQAGIWIPYFIFGKQAKEELTK